MKITFTKDVLITAGVQKNGTSLEVDDYIGGVVKALGCGQDYVEPEEDLQTTAETQDAEETKVETKTVKTTKAAK